MSILVFGKSGQVARELQSLAPVVALSRQDADLSDPVSCATAISRHQPEAVINAAAYTAVDNAEDEEELATVINGEAPATMARVCAELGIPFVHISTDYVFDGSGKAPWFPADEPSPISAYGRSKLAGEIGVVGAGGRYAILRTSWVFSAYGKNFVKTMLRLGVDHDQLNIVADQIGGPTPASAIAGACVAMVEQLATDPAKAGIYHFTGDPDVSWAGFAREIFGRAQIDCEVVEVPSTDYPTIAPRPLNSRLDCGSLTTTFGIPRPDWRPELSAVLKQILDKEDEI